MLLVRDGFAYNFEEFCTLYFTHVFKHFATLHNTERATIDCKRAQ